VSIQKVSVVVVVEQARVKSRLDDRAISYSVEPDWAVHEYFCGSAGSLNPDVPEISSMAPYP